MDDNKKRDIIERYEYYKQRKADLKKEAETANEEFEKAEQELADLMIDSDEPITSLGEYQYALKISTKYNFKSMEALAELGIDDKYKVLKDNGFGFLVKETVDSRTLNTTINEALAEDGGGVPDEVMEIIKPYELTGISRTKLKTKAAKALKAKKGDRE